VCVDNFHIWFLSANAHATYTWTPEIFAAKLQAVELWERVQQLCYEMASAWRRIQSVWQMSENTKLMSEFLRI